MRLSIPWISLHATYVTYVTSFLAEDAHFVAIRDSLPLLLDSSKIVQPSKLEWTHEERVNVVPDSDLRI